MVMIFDAIVVGARVAGSPTAMLLARQGYDVLLVDRATFPSDTISTHLVHPPGIAALERWGLLDKVTASGCPPIDTYSFDFGPFALSGAPDPDGAVAYGPRRTLLDKILVDAAVDAGAKVREGFTVESMVDEDDQVVGVRGHSKGGASVTEHARVVIGADGRHSLVAQAVNPYQYHDKPPLLAAYYAYWSGVPIEGTFETYVRPSRGMAAWPTNDDLTVVIAGWPFAEFEANKKDIEGNFLRTYDLAPSFAERLRAGSRETRFVGTAVPNFFRKPYGPGWALVGDAGYNKDFITAQGIHDAFRDAELCVTALDEALSGVRSFDAAMADYQTRRDEQVLAMYGSPLNWQPWNRRRRSCNSCWAPCRATRKPWTALLRSTPVSPHLPSSSARPTSSGSCLWRASCPKTESSPPKSSVVIRMPPPKPIPTVKSMSMP